MKKRSVLNLVFVTLSGCASLDPKSVDRFGVAGTAFTGQVIAHRECIIRRGISENEIKSGQVNATFESAIELHSTEPQIKSFKLAYDSKIDKKKAEILDQCRLEANAAAVRDIKETITKKTSSDGENPESFNGYQFFADGRLYPEVSATFHEKFSLTKGTIKPTNK